MTVIDEYFQKVEKEPLEIFESSKKLIYKWLKQQFTFLLYMKDDIVSECAVVFWSKCIKEYDCNRGVIIWKYLQNQYYYIILDICKKERQNLMSPLDENTLSKDLCTNVDLPVCIKLTEEQKKILTLIIAGYSYKEIFNIIGLPNNTKEQKRPIYRRVVEIKTKIAKWYGIDYKPPRC